METPEVVFNGPLKSRDLSLFFNQVVEEINRLKEDVEELKRDREVEVNGNRMERQNAFEISSRLEKLSSTLAADTRLRSLIEEIDSDLEDLRMEVVALTKKARPEVIKRDNILASQAGSQIVIPSDLDFLITSDEGGTLVGSNDPKNMFKSSYWRKVSMPQEARRKKVSSEIRVVAPSSLFSGQETNRIDIVPFPAGSAMVEKIEVESDSGAVEEIDLSEYTETERKGRLVIDIEKRTLAAITVGFSTSDSEIKGRDKIFLYGIGLSVEEIEYGNMGSFRLNITPSDGKKITLLKEIFPNNERTENKELLKSDSGESPVKLSVFGVSGSSRSLVFDSSVFSTGLVPEEGIPIPSGVESLDIEGLVRNTGSKVPIIEAVKITYGVQT